MDIKVAETDKEIERCFPVLLQLRMHLTPSGFIQQVRRMMDKYGYRLVYLEEDGQIKAVAGFRITEMLSRGQFLYIDDLIIPVRHRSKGYGSALFKWLLDYARHHECAEVHADPGAQWRDAYGFYLRNGMQINGYHFMLRLT